MENEKLNGASPIPRTAVDEAVEPVNETDQEAVNGGIELIPFIYKCSNCGKTMRLLCPRGKTTECVYCGKNTATLI